MCESIEKLICGRSGGKSGLEGQGYKDLLPFNTAEKRGRKGSRKFFREVSESENERNSIPLHVGKSLT